MSSPICNPKRCTPYHCIIQSFADGDTCTVAVQCTCAASYHVIKVRLADIDSYEPSGKTKELAQIVKEKLESHFKYRRGELYLRTSNSDRFGRVIGDIKINGKMLSGAVVEMGLAWHIT